MYTSWCVCVNLVCAPERMCMQMRNKCWCVRKRKYVSTENTLWKHSLWILQLATQHAWLLSSFLPSTFFGQSSNFSIFSHLDSKKRTLRHSKCCFSDGNSKTMQYFCVRKSFSWQRKSLREQNITSNLTVRSLKHTIFFNSSDYFFATDFVSRGFTG